MGKSKTPKRIATNRDALQKYLDSFTKQPPEEELGQDVDLLEPEEPKLKTLVRKRTELETGDEVSFSNWYETIATRTGIDKNPDHPKQKFDYRGYYDKYVKGKEDVWLKDAEETLQSDPGAHLFGDFKDSDHPTKYKDALFQEERENPFESLLEPQTERPASLDTGTIREGDVAKFQEPTENQKIMKQYNKDFDEINTAIEDSLKNLDRTDQKQIDEVNGLINLYKKKITEFQDIFPAFKYLPPDVLNKMFEKSSLIRVGRNQYVDVLAEDNILNKLTKQGFDRDEEGNFGDDKQQANAYQTMIKAMNRELPISEIEKDSDLRGTPLGRIGGSFGQGILSIPEGFLGMGEYLADITGVEPLKQTFKSAADDIRNTIESIAPADPNFMENVFSGFGSLISFMIPGAIVSNLGRVAGLGQKVAGWMGVGASSIMESMTEAGLIYRETGNPDAAAKTFLANLLLVTVTNKIGIQSDRVPGLRKLLLSAPMEGLQEVGQELISERSKGTPWDQIDINQLFEVFGIGSIVGGGVGFVMPGAVEPGQQQPPIEQRGGQDVRPDQPQDLRYEQVLGDRTNVAQVGPEGVGLENLTDLEEDITFENIIPQAAPQTEPTVTPVETPSPTGEAVKLTEKQQKQVDEFDNPSIYKKYLNETETKEYENTLAQIREGNDVTDNFSKLGDFVIKIEERRVTKSEVPLGEDISETETNVKLREELKQQQEAEKKTTLTGQDILKKIKLVDTREELEDIDKRFSKVAHNVSERERIEYLDDYSKAQDRIKESEVEIEKEELPATEKPEKDIEAAASTEKITEAPEEAAKPLVDKTLTAGDVMSAFDTEIDMHTPLRSKELAARIKNRFDLTNPKTKAAYDWLQENDYLFSKDMNGTKAKPYKDIQAIEKEDQEIIRQNLVTGEKDVIPIEEPKSRFADLTDKELAEKTTKVQHKLLAAGSMDLPPGVDVRSPVDKALFKQLKAEKLSRDKKKVEKPKLNNIEKTFKRTLKNFDNARKRGETNITLEDITEFHDRHKAEGNISDEITQEYERVRDKFESTAKPKKEDTFIKDHIIVAKIKPDKIAKVDKEIDDTIKSMLKNTKLTTGIDPVQLALGVKLTGLYIEKGVYTLQDIMQQVYDNHGKEALQKLFKAIKQSYNAYVATATDEQIEKMSDVAAIRKLTIEDFATETKDYTEGFQEEAEKVGLTKDKAVEVFEGAFTDKQPAQPGERHILLTGGLPSAGKSLIRNQLMEQGKDFKNSVLVDSDENKHLLLPGQAAKAHELSSLIAKQQLQRAQDESYNYVYDSQLSNYPLAKQIIEDVLNNEGLVTIGFMDIDAEVSRIRSVVRFLSGESDRFIPAEAIVKGYNTAKPTFLQLYREYRDNPDVKFIMNDANTQGKPAFQVFEQEEDDPKILNDERFGKFIDISYNKVGEGKELRYELTEKYTTEQLAEAEEKIISEIRNELSTRGNEFSRGELTREIAKQEAKAKGKELKDVEPDTAGIEGIAEGEQTEGIPETGEAEPTAGVGEQEDEAVSGTIRADTESESGRTPGEDIGDRTPRIQRNRSNYRIKQNELNESTFNTTQRYADNLAAIQLLKELQKKKSKKATKPQQAILAKYVGWGGMSQVFDPRGQDYLKWEQRQEELQELLSEIEYDAAERSTINAFFTSPTTINFMWKLAGKLGFKGGNILEPGMGVGNFFGLMPKGISDNSFLTGIELDTTTAQIAQYLYPDAEINNNENVGKGYEQIFVPANSQDLVITNVPFANVQMYDPTEPQSYWSKNKMSLHNFFIMKSIDKVKPGGLMMIITSHFTMDGKTLGFRQKLSEQADLIAAYKLPHTAFKGVAGTDVTTDIIIVRKKDDNIPFEGKKHKWINSKEVEYEGEKVDLNEYYLDNPRDVFGQLSSKGTQYGPAAELTVKESGSLDEHIRKALNRAQTDMFTATPELKAAKKKKGKNLSQVSKTNADNYFVRDGKVYRADEDGELIEVKGIAKKEIQRFKQMSELRDGMLDSFNLQLSSSNDTAVKASVELLDDKYDKFVEKFGLLNDKENIRFFKSDPDYSRLRALEVFDSKAEVWEKSDLLKGRVFRAEEKKTEFTGTKDVLGYVLAETGGIDIAQIAQLTGKTKEEVTGELISDGAIYEDLNGELVTENEYLSGEVVAKLASAKEAVKKDEKFKRNVAALEGVQPERVKFVDIQPTLGTNFIPGEVYSEFINDIFDTNIEIEVRYVQLVERGKWIFNTTGQSQLGSSAKNTTKFGTDKFSGYDLLQKVMNNSTPTVYDTFSDGTKKVNQAATELARDKMQSIKEEWTKFLVKSTESRTAVEKAYNELLNTSSRRVYSGKHLTLPGAAHIVLGKEYNFRPYQKDAIWRMSQNRNNLLDHPVGSGKTGTLIAGIMERIRLGLTKKAIYITKKPLVGQVFREAQGHYPQAKILMPEAKDFTLAERPAFLNRIKTHDWDVVILSIQNFKNLSLTPEIEIDYTRQQLAELEIALEAEVADAEDAGYSRKSNTQKELEKKKLRLEQKMIQRQTEIDEGRKGTKRQLEYFDELGIDYMVVDESHNYKNLFAPTSRTRVKGIGTSESQQAFDMSMKIWWINQQPGWGVTFATGTPVSNALTEFYIVQRYLQEDDLKQKNIRSLDAWMNLFAETQTKLEITPEGKGMRESSRVSKLVNLPELMKMYSKTTDIVTPEEVAKHFDLPKIKGGKAETVEIPISDDQIAYYESLATRMGLVREGKVDPKDDGALQITNEGRAVATDIRLVNKKFADDPNSKLNVATDYIYDIWEETKKDKLTQVVFNDMGVPKKPGKEGPISQVNLYEDMKQKLIQKGVPEKEIAFIHDAKDENKRIALFQAVNDGEVRILMGNTPRMSEGVNIQRRLYALHHINPTWKPAELTQREGRIIRPNNINKEIRIIRYVTTGIGDVAGFDAYMYQLLENKIRGIAQASNPDTTVRSVEEAEGRALTYAEIKAIATGNPLIMEKIEIDAEVGKLERLRNEHSYQLGDTRAELSRIPQEIETRQKILTYADDLLEKASKDENISILDKNYDLLAARAKDELNKTEGKKNENLHDNLKKEAGQAIADKAAALVKAKDDGNHKIGEYGNLDVYLDVNTQKVVTSFDDTKGYVQTTVFLKILPKEFGKYADIYEYRHLAVKSFELASAGGVNVNRILEHYKHIEKWAGQYREAIKGMETKMAGLKEEGSAPFPREKDYQAKLKRQREIDSILNVDEAAKSYEEETETEETGEDVEKGAIKPKLYEILKTKEIYKVQELADESGKPAKEVSNALNDLRKQKLVEAVPGGFKPTEEFKVLLDDLNQNPEKYEDDFSKLYSNPLPAILKGIGRLQRSIDDAYKNLIGDKIYKAAGSLVSKITPEKIKDLVITNNGLPTEYVAVRREGFDSFQRYQELAKDLGKLLTYRNPATGEKFSEADQKRLTQIIKGGLTSNTLLRERANLAIREIKELEILGKQLETLPIETYNTKLPRKRINELLKQKAEFEKQKDKILDGLAFEGELSEEQQKAQDKATRNIDRKIDDIHTKVKNSFIHGGEGYIKRVYLTKEQTKAFKKYGYTRPTRLDLTSAMHRKDIPYEIRKKMGEVLTAAYPAAKGIMLEGKDVSFGRFFEVVSENPDWASESEVAGWVKMENEPKLGKLKGMFVEPKIAGDINDVMRFTDKDEIDKFLKRINATWKATKTIMNPSTHMRNIYSNTILLDFSGVPHIEQLALLPEAIRAIRGQGKYAAEFKASRLNNTTFTQQELGQYLDVVRENSSFMDMSLPDKILKVYGKASLVDTKLGQFMGKVYQMEEVYGKAVKFIHERQKGHSIIEARNEANKWLFDYSEIPKLVRYLRSNPVWGVPFITWSYKAFPRIIESAMTRPLAFWKYPVIFSAIAKYSLQALDIDDDDWEELVKNLPERMIKGEWLLMPFKDSNNKLQMLDLTYILPYKDVYDMFASSISLVSTGQLNNSDDIVDGLFGLIQAPIMKTAAELMTNKNTYSNQQIWFDVDDPLEKAAKAFDHMYKTFMPSLTPEIPFMSQGGYGYHKLRSVISKREDYYGRSFTLAPAISSSLLGFKTSPLEPEKNIERRLSKLQSEMIQFATKRNRVLRDGGLSEDKRVEGAADIDIQMDAIRQEIQDMKLPVKNPNISKVESEIGKLQRELGKVDLKKIKVRVEISRRISILKIKLNSLMSEPDAFTGELKEKDKKSKGKSLKKDVRKSLKKEL